MLKKPQCVECGGGHEPSGARFISGSRVKYQRHAVTLTTSAQLQLSISGLGSCCVGVGLVTICRIIDMNPTPTKSMSKHYGYNCTVCGEPIKEPQATEHTSDGLAHAKCCRPKCAQGKPDKQNRIMKTKKAMIRIQNSIKIAERTVAVLKGMNIENSECVALAEKNLASAKALLK